MRLRTILLLGSILFSSLSRAADVTLNYGTSYTYTPGIVNINYSGSVSTGGIGTGAFTIRVFLANATSSYYVGLFHHQVTTACVVGGPSYTESPLGPLDYSFFSTAGAPPCASSQTASFSVPSCIPNGTYNVMLEVYAHPVFFVGTGYSGSFTLAINSITQPIPPVTFLLPYGDVAAPYGILATSTIGTHTVSGGGSYTVTRIGTPATCSAYSTILLSMSGGTAPYTIYLYRGATSTTYTTATSSYTHTFTTAGPYTFIVRDAAGCSYYLTGTISPPTQPTLTVTPTSQTVCKNRCLTFNASVSSGTGYSYSWTQSYPPSSSSVVSTSASFCRAPVSSSSTANTPNTFACTATNAFGCSATATTVITVLPNCSAVMGACCLGPRRIGDTDNNQELTEMLIYPNPGSDLLTIALPPLSGTGNTLEFISADGRLVKQVFLTSDLETTELSVSDLVAGMYLITLRDEQGVVAQSRFVKE